ncbi:hypothetical protein ACFPT7_07170 [Acidicapsa dinghuensis]|uniref:Uncharacterized protein n=1 Tax=Acidicapsa dinghuensis TaxID=2218256 RepID=A0ABW1ED87_9BACT|nr:hypothetical protein [Acidicapsa dinghuensis]
MAIGAAELRRWIESLPEASEVAIDEGGLTLIEIGGDAYLEVGGVPLENEDSLHSTT